MPKRKPIQIEAAQKLPPVRDPEAREQQLIALAENCAEALLLKGTAPAPIIVHYLRRATERERLENEKLKLELDLTKAKTEAIKAGQANTKLFEDAIAAMRKYRGEDGRDEQDPNVP